MHLKVLSCSPPRQAQALNHVPVAQRVRDRSPGRAGGLGDDSESSPGEFWALLCPQKGRKEDCALTRSTTSAASAKLGVYSSALCEDRVQRHVGESM